jgi:hypothetical protein
LTGDAVLVGQQAHGDAVLVAKRAMTDAIVARNADHGAIQLRELALQIAELDRLGRAAGRIIAHIEKQYERLAQVIRQFGNAHIRVGQFEIRRGRLVSACIPLLAIYRKHYMNKQPVKSPRGLPASNRNNRPRLSRRRIIPCKRLLGGMSVEKFLAEHWHKKPLLVRQALPNFGDWLDRDGLSELACLDNSEGRLVQFKRGRCQLEYGPFEPETCRLPKSNWSLLVSGVNHLLPEADWLLHRFDFIPAARLDDLMVSFAPPGGGVGPHFDSYDVFLIQGQGRRRWEISAQDDLTVVEGAPLRILKEFRVDESWELEPGDMLYLPPQLAHNGVALTDCMTWSSASARPRRRKSSASS